MPKSFNSDPLSTVLKELKEVNNERDSLIVEDIVNTFDSRTYGPLLLASSLLVISPFGMIPFVPTVVGLLTAIISIQLSFGRESPWIPKALKTLNVPKSKLSKAIDKSLPWATSIESWIKPRLDLLTKPVAQKITGIFITCLSLTMPLLGIIPFAVIVPATGILFFSIALTSRDGLYMLIGMLFFILACVLMLYTL